MTEPDIVVPDDLELTVLLLTALALALECARSESFEGFAGRGLSLELRGSDWPSTDSDTTSMGGTESEREPRRVEPLFRYIDGRLDGGSSYRDSC